MIKVPYILALLFVALCITNVSAQDEIAATYVTVELNDYQDEYQEYTEIEIIELTMAVQDELAKKFEGLRIYKAYIAKDNTYKVVLKGKNNFTKVVFASANGEWIKPNAKS
ncbi:hypothetical protein [Aquimarina brevivitae]|uniref:DUF3888 domain-containing protein n=1 Tax=Aquimarina brevivitae TaxID=323412 RepID=A0A4Q7PI06_9FLAO|nr:hypothetical protein [Aquimarina brevivitae]RZS99598.1 hypothetical protein EV197_0820 [Aquimarina brevivitae]